MKIADRIKNNKILFFVGLIYMVLFITIPEKAAQSLDNSMYYIKEMIEIIPVIFLLTSLIEAWVPKQVIMNGFGEKAGFRGNLTSLMLGSFSAGPIYAAFPVCKTLMKKGASITNVVILLSTWAVLKVPMLLNEAKFLGVRFMVIRWILTVIAIFAMSYIVALIVKKEDIPTVASEGAGTFAVNAQYCVGCGICSNMLPEHFEIVNGKVRMINEQSLEKRADLIKSVAEKCPAKAIEIV